jgi:sulfite reductase (NADPH) flavoprotein alpha-component
MTRQATMLASVPPGAEPWVAAPFDAALSSEVRQLIERMDSRQRLWLSGYLAGSLAPAAAAPAMPAPDMAPALVLFGSQSGNSERVARETAAALAGRNVPCKTMDMLDCRKGDLAAAKILLVVVSTQGDGDPPDRAVPLWELLSGRKAPRLDHLRYCVLALGDSSYEHFCETGRRFDEKLHELGATRLHDRIDCDVDFEEPARTWAQAVVEKLAAEVSASAPAGAVAQEPQPVVVSNAYTRRNPFLAEVLANDRLTARGSSKDVRHIELSLAGSHIRYEPGDAIGIVPRNPARAVEELIEALPAGIRSASGDIDGLSLHEALATRFDIGPVTAGFLRRYAAATHAPELLALVAEGNEERLTQFAQGRDVFDIVRAFPPRDLDAAEFAALLRPLAPRLYSIASSAHASPDEAHLTVGIAQHEVRGEVRQGVGSGMLSAASPEGSPLPVYLHRNPAFRLPAPDVPIIMIGPGTGVAPFRAFVAEREALAARGRNWLFFGERVFETDFLYQAEWLAWRKQGVLTRLDVAFSRDQANRIYVQHRLLEQGREVWAWLAEGACVYVCGDALRMAPDVHAALIEVARRHGGHTEESAAEYLADLQRQRRYQRDVY